MQTIYLHHPYDRNAIVTEPIVLALGFFDGVHRGHQRVIEEARRVATKKGQKLGLLTFTRHPSILYTKYDQLELNYLTTPERKQVLLEHFGVDILYKVEFTSLFSSLSPQEFVDQYVIGLHASTVVAGFDYTYGKKEVANMQNLSAFSQNRFDIVEVAPSLHEHEKISSTRIRETIKAGDLETAKDLLGYAYCTTGFVVRGDARGRELGFPTANVHLAPSICVPRKGVYAVQVVVAGQTYGGMASIGYNVTFEARSTLSIEVHIFDFKKDIYGETMAIYWLSYLRDEVKYTGPGPLIAQLQADETRSRHILEQEHPPLI